MNNKILKSLVTFPFTAFFTPSSKGVIVHVFKDGELVCSLGAFVEARKLRGVLHFSFYLARKEPGAIWLDIFDNHERYASRARATALADQQLYEVLRRFDETNKVDLS